MAYNTVPMSGNDIRFFVSEVARKLPDDETHNMVAVGRGALMVFYDYDNVGTTYDLDTFMLYADHLPNILYTAITEVAAENGLGQDWMNDDIANAEWNNREDVPDLDVNELRTFFLNGNEEFFFNDNDYPTLSITPIDELGIWAAKILADRDKDQEVMLKLFDMFNKEVVSWEVLHFSGA